MTRNVICIVGSSIASTGSGSGWLGIRDRFPDVNLLDAGDGDDVARAGFFDLHPLQSLETEQLLDARLPARRRPASMHRHGLALADGAAIDAADGDPAEIFVVIHQRYLHLQRLVGSSAGRGNMAR